MRKRCYMRKMMGIVAIAIGGLIIALFVPLWVWYTTLIILTAALIYTLYCLYVR